MSLNVGQAFQPAGLPDFPVRWIKNGRLESRPNPQCGKPALRASPGLWSQCMQKNEMGAFHEPQGRAGCPQPAGRRRGEDTAPYQLPWFMVPMHGFQAVDSMIVLFSSSSWSSSSSI